MLVVLWLAAGSIVAFLGRNRELGFWGFFLASLILSPPIVLLALVLTQQRTPSRQRRPSGEAG